MVSFYQREIQLNINIDRIQSLLPMRGIHLYLPYCNILGQKWRVSQFIYNTLLLTHVCYSILEILNFD